MKQPVYFKDLGVKPYKQTWDYQESLLHEAVELKRLKRESAELENNGVPIEETKHHLLLVEHPPVYTLGKNGKEEHVLLNTQELGEKNIEYFHINRGGDITFHGLGQIVAYPIFDLDKFSTDLGWYLRSLEEVIIKTLAHYGLQGMRSKGETGVWLDADTAGKERKICAIGIKCSRWITMHGFAFNVNTDLTYFNHIIPCGIQNKKVTSLNQELGKTIDMTEVKEIVKQNFIEMFNIELI